MINNSCLYIGKVIHKRFKPKEHYFKYKVFSMFINLDEIKKINSEISFFSYNKFNLISFYDKDHGDRDGSSLKSWVKNKLEQVGIEKKIDRVNLLCYPRILGYVFNPLSIFFVYDKSSSLIAIMYEVKNTFGEQHTYIFKVKNSNILQHSCSKKFHVSPFIEMNCNYYFKNLKPGEKISVIIDQYQLNEKLLYASQDGKRADFTSRELIKSYLKHPLMTLKIISAIHFEAFKLWTKGIKFIKKKLKIKNNITFEN
mgnify:CR=1 FL=1